MKPSRFFTVSIALAAAIMACTSAVTSAPGASEVPPEATLTPTQSGAPADTATAQPSGTPDPTPRPRIATRTPAAPTPTITPPAPNPAYALLNVQLQAVQVSDDDGQRLARITAQQVKKWVDKANEIYAKASVRLMYDPGSDFATLQSTILNGMTGDTDANWSREVEAGNRVAAGYAGKLVVFFVYGPGRGPEGRGFSSTNYNFVEMPGFNDTGVCGYQNIGLFAHEVGHYFGLFHPFTQIFANLQAAESYLTAHGNDPGAFDGDGLSDTPPDPYIDLPEYQCNPGPSVTLNGRVFPLPRLNIMSYYSTSGVDRTDLTPQQSSKVRWVLSLRAKNGMATPTNLGVPGAIEFATLPVKSAAGLAPAVQDMSPFSDTPRWNGDKQLFATAQPKSLIGFSISVGAAGTYNFDLYATMAPDYGRLQTLADGSPLGAPVDLYAPLVLPSGKISIGTLDLSAGPHTLSFRVVGKNDASTGYSLGLDAFTLTPVQK
jgi:hypothetical protein